MDLDFGQDSEELKKLEVSKSTSKLDKAIQKLITILFDIESMKKAMVEFEVRNGQFYKLPSSPVISTRGKSNFNPII